MMPRCVVHGVSVSGGVVSEEGMHCSANTPQDASFGTHGLGVFAISDPFGAYASEIGYADLNVRS